MSQTSPILNLPYIQPAQAQKHVTHNEAIAALEIAVQLSVQAHTVSTPPTAPSLGARYIVPAGGGASWGASAGDVAVWDGSGWNFITPQEGWQAYTSEGPATLQFNGAEWVEAGRAETADIFGINATADAVNRLSVASEATLLNHVGAGHQVKVNKAGETDTGSLLFQTNWSGRAEMGTLGNDNFEIKVSGDGNTWITALQFAGATGLASGAAVQSGPTDTSAGKLARADYAYGPGNVLGAVSQTSGVPTGAVIERGSNADGDYVRFADGTQICWSPAFIVDVTLSAGAIFRSAPVNWTYPAAFASAPALTPGGQDDATSYWSVPGLAGLSNASASAMSYQSVSSKSLTLCAVGHWF